MPPAAGAPGVATIVPRVVSPWAAPAVCALFGVNVPGPLCWASAAASGLEFLLFLCQQSKDLRRSLGAILRLLPLPLRLGLLLAIQLWMYNVLDGGAADSRGQPQVMAAASQPGLRAGDGLVVPPPRPAQAPPPPPPPPPREQASAASADSAALAAAQVGRNAVLAGGGSAAEEIGTDQFGNPFRVDEDLKTLAWDPKTISVVLPCAEEREYALKTVKAIFDNTPPEVLQEIIVVDDGSNPPLAETHLGPEIQKRYKVKVMRHEQTVGLIGAKKTGGDAMTGDIGAFFDCHVAPQPGWWQDFLTLIGQNWRRMVVPQITALDIDTWKQQSAGGGMAKCYLTWDADFKWFDSDDMYIAVISGGLLGISRRWWFETGGYDTHMLGWGGENLDQSLRMWLCGGEIVVASNSQVAHMWRTGDHRTSARYRHVGDSGVNRARAVYAWYGEFAEKLGHYPNFNRRSYNEGQPWYGDLSNIKAIKDRLKCRPFAWFLRRFKAIYEDAGLIPSEVFMIRDEQSGKCLKFEGYAGTAGSGVSSASLHACGGKGDHRFWWHLGNRNRKGGQCCSGLRAWNTDQCLQDTSQGKWKTGVCDVSGHNSMQHWALSASTGMIKTRDICVGVVNDKIQSKPCLALKGGSRWSKEGSYVPLETETYRRTRTEHPELFTKLDAELAKLPGVSTLCDKVGGCFKLFSDAKCLDDGMAFTTDVSACSDFFYKDQSLHPAAEEKGCLDMWNDNDPMTWGIGGCHHGDNQKFKKSAQGAYCDNSGFCMMPRVVSS